MKSPMWLLKCILEESGMRCSTTTSRDFDTLSRRFEHEGLSLLTITLPAFGKAFERWLEQGQVSPLARVGFRSRAGYCCPEIFSGMLGQVFELKSGRILSVPNVDAILCIRQICLLFKKVELECTPERKFRALTRYVEIESELSKVQPLDPGSRLDEAFMLVSGYLWPRVLNNVVNAIQSYSLEPGHGTGATADSKTRNQKYVTDYWHDRLNTFFPVDWYGQCNVNHTLDESEGLLSCRTKGPDEEDPVKVIFVPKTLKTPRVIAMEPAVMQYIQQGVLRSLVREIEDHPLTRGLINFSDQGVNRGLALSSSKDGKYATLDLSEASDRVLEVLVSQMLDNVPVFRDAIRACRSTRARLEDGRVIELLKFASMGSALCFPIEAMMFFSIIMAARIAHRADQTGILSVYTHDFKEAYVYGDDIIIPVDEVEIVSSALTRYGLKLNTDKCFSKGNFRESCGMDAYDGRPVKPVYLRRMLPTDKRSAPCVASLVSFHNQLEEAGWLATAEQIRQTYTGPFRIPCVSETSPLLGWILVDGTTSSGRWNHWLHRKEIFGPVGVSTRMADPLDGYAALHKYFLRSQRSTLDEKEVLGVLPEVCHLSRTVKPRASALKREWCPA